MAPGQARGCVVTMRMSRTCATSPGSGAKSAGGLWEQAVTTKSVKKKREKEMWKGGVKRRREKETYDCFSRFFFTPSFHASLQFHACMQFFTDSPRAPIYRTRS